ncbi:hypothetical protein N9Z38_02260 [Mariniblastus sp.]|nr:hypothetical protein [Mariniblastus sp.]
MFVLNKTLIEEGNSRMITRKNWQSHKKRLGDGLVLPKKKTNVGPNLDKFHSKKASPKEKQAALKLISAGLELYAAANKTSNGEVKLLIKELKKQCQHSSEQITDEGNLVDVYFDKIEADMKKLDAIITKKYLKAIAEWQKATVELNKVGDGPEGRKKSLDNIFRVQQAEANLDRIADAFDTPLMDLNHEINDIVPTVKHKRAKDVYKRGKKILKQAFAVDKFYKDEIWNKR